MTRDENLAVAACLLLVAVNDESMRNLTAKQRQVAIGGRRKAADMLVASKVQPARLKDLAYEIIERKAELSPCR